MKRHNALILAFVLFFAGLSSLPASVFADYDKEITFRGLPMGSSIEEIKSKLLEDGVSETEFKFSSNSEMSTLFSLFYEDKYEFSWIKDGGYHAYIMDTGKLELAGYDDFSLNLDFMYEVVDGVPNKNQNNEGLSAARYYINCTEYDQLKVFSDLKQKLITLYGTPSETLSMAEKFGEKDKIRNLEIWYGANNTVVFICRVWFTNDGVTAIKEESPSFYYAADDVVYVFYGKTDSIERFRLLQDYENRLANEAEQKKLEKVVNDTTGL